MADSFANQVAELERALALVEGSLAGRELERARALVAALLSVHQHALQDLQRVLGSAELARAAAAEPSVAWLLACHEVHSAELERALSVAEEKQARRAAERERLDGGFVPVERLSKRGAA